MIKYQIFNCDCLAKMASLPPKSIDLIFCDLPYGCTDNKWDSIIPLPDLWSAYKRLIKENGVILLSATMRFAVQLINSNFNMFRYNWVWQKTTSVGFLNVKYSPLKVHEFILVFANNSKFTFNPQKTKGKPYFCKASGISTNYSCERVSTINASGDRYPSDVQTFSIDKGFHPTQKPIKMLEYFIKTYTNSNDIILDNCMGSGSCGVAALNLQRNFIGIEKDVNYFEKAKKRIETHIASNLFLFNEAKNDNIFNAEREVKND